MDKKTTLEMIAAISNANGTSGFEDEVVAAIRPYAEGLGEITEDHTPTPHKASLQDAKACKPLTP